MYKRTLLKQGLNLTVDIQKRMVYICYINYIYNNHIKIYKRVAYAVANIFSKIR